MNRDALAAQLRRQEGVRAKPYRDIVGKLTAGVGRNIDDVPFSDDEIALMLSNDIQTADRLARNYPWYASLSDARQNVVANLMFNMGPTTFAQFHHFHAAMSAGDWPGAAESLRNSKWHGQVKGRALELEQQLLDDVLP